MKRLSLAVAEHVMWITLSSMLVSEAIRPERGFI
jgi:hypothetical protein